MTSGRVSACAPWVINCGSWFSSTAWRFTVMPVLAVKSLAICCVFVKRSVWFSRLHTVIDFAAALSVLPPLSPPEPHPVHRP